MVPLSRMLIRSVPLTGLLLGLWALVGDHFSVIRVNPGPTPALQEPAINQPSAPAPGARPFKTTAAAKKSSSVKTSGTYAYPPFPQAARPPRGSDRLTLPPHLQKLDRLVKKHARLQGVEEDLVWAVIRQESGFNPKAVSPKGAMGLMQLMPATAVLLWVTDPFEVEQNIAGGVKFLALCLKRFQGDVCLALAAYNAGPDNVVKYQGIPPFPETLNYVAAVGRELSGHPRLKGLRLASLNFPAAAESDAPAPKQSGLDWKVPAPQWKVSEPQWKVPEPQWKVPAPTLRKNLRTL